MTDYKKGLIYTIRSPHTDNIYIGSTCQRLSKRLYVHKCNFRQYKNGAIKYMTSYKILEYGDEYMELLESYPCNSKIELHKREGELIRQYKDVCVNICVAGRTKKQYKMENKEKIKQYQIENKEKINAREKIRYHNNLEKERERSRNYRERNIEQSLARSRKYYLENKELVSQTSKLRWIEQKDKLSEKHNCECGDHYTLQHKARHEKTKKHLDFMKQ